MKKGRKEPESFLDNAQESRVCVPVPTDWLTATEAAAYLKIKPRTLLLWVRQGRVQGFAVGGTKRRVWRFRREDLDAALLASAVLPSTSPSVLVAGGGS